MRDAVANPHAPDLNMVTIDDDCITSFAEMSYNLTGRPSPEVHPRCVSVGPQEKPRVLSVS